jgi:SET domain-containing protein
VFSTAVPSPLETLVGKYCSRVWAGDQTLPNDQTQYVYSLSIGPVSPKTKMGYTAWVDAEKMGSVFRFVNHNCDPNVQVTDIRRGMETSILAVETIQDIATGEELTIAYNRAYCK